MSSLKIIFFLFLTTVQLATYGSNEIVIEPLPSSLSSDDSIISELDDQLHKHGTSIGNTLFDNLTSLDLFDFTPNDNIKLRVHVNRKIYDNKDILNSWTVVDRFSIPFSITLPILTSSFLGSGTDLTVSFVNQLGFDIINIRQTSPKNYNLLNSTSNIEENLREGIKKLPKESLSEEEKSLFKTYFSFQHPLMNARYSKFLNLVTHPLRVPINDTNLEKMETGEISSYSINGMVGFLLDANLNVVSLSSSFNSLLSASVYYRGKYQVAILKEDKDHVRIKLTRESGDGSSFGYNMKKDLEIFEGVFILGEDFGEISTSPVPFSFKTSRENIKSFDVGYRYNIRNKMARKAFYEATLGNFAKSDIIANSAKEGGVRKIFSREQNKVISEKKYGLKVNFVWERNHTVRKEEIKATIQFPDGKYEIIKSVLHNYRINDPIIGGWQSSTYRFVPITVKKNGMSIDVGLTVSTDLKDRATNGQELREYIEEVEQGIGDTSLFPDIPKYYPLDPAYEICAEPDIGEADLYGDLEECRTKIRLADYGISDFSYKLRFTNDQIKKFFTFPEHKMWPLLEKAFRINNNSWSKMSDRAIHRIKNSYATLLNLPLSLVDVNIPDGSNIYRAAVFLRKWKKLAKKTLARENTSIEMAEMLNTTYFSREIIRVLRLLLKDELINYSLNAKNLATFGTINNRVGNSSLDPGQYIEGRADRIIDFNKGGRRTSFDTTASINGLKLYAQDRDHIILTFDLETNPHLIYLNINLDHNYKHINLFKYIGKNNDLFVKGKNSIMINKKDKKGIRGYLSKALFNNKRTKLSLAITNKSAVWGEVGTVKFKAP